MKTLISIYRSRSEFLRNLLTLMSGTAVAQVIPFLAVPFLSRVYSPKEFGFLALLHSLTTIFSSFAAGKYEQALLLPNNRRTNFLILVLCLFINLAISLLTLVGVLLFGSVILKLLGIEGEFIVWLYLFPFILFFSSCYNSFSNFFIRRGKFKLIAGASILKANTNTSLSLAVSLFSTAFGLLIGFFVGFISPVIFYFSKINTDYRDFKKSCNHFTLKRCRVILVKYIDFPKFTVPGGLLNTLSLNFNNFFINNQFSVSQLGYYSFGFRYVLAPLGLLEDALRKIFMQKSAEELEQTGSVKNIFKGTLIKLTLVSVPSFSILYLFIKDLVVFVFGSEWEMAGEITEILIPMFGIRFVVSPLSVVNQILEQQKMGLLIQSLYFLIVVSIGITSFYFHLSFLTFVQFYAHALIVFYTIYLFEEFYVVFRKK